MARLHSLASAKDNSLRIDFHDSVIPLSGIFYSSLPVVSRIKYLASGRFGVLPRQGSLANLGVFPKNKRGRDVTLGQIISLQQSSDSRDIETAFPSILPECQAHHRGSRLRARVLWFDGRPITSQYGGTNIQSYHLSSCLKLPYTLRRKSDFFFFFLNMKMPEIL